MRPRFIPRRRPSAALIISVVALFVALGGVGYAAVSIPYNSVGEAQLKHSSVTHSKLRFDSVNYQDIVPGAVGRVRANLAQLQARVNGTCANGSAVGAVASNGAVTCNPARPSEFGAIGTQTVNAATTVASANLPAGTTYLAFANPSATVAAAEKAPVNVTCTLTVGDTKQSATATVAPGATASLPLQVAGPAGAATVSCATTGGTPASVTTGLNAIETSSNN
ncbi:MAG TPA: hypothetical protein VFN55_16035 [Solirubrobacteraceae bacterium]|nr:hypothetical protein [Solirubrobacteraceae bacterium]